MGRRRRRSRSSPGLPPRATAAAREPLGEAEDLSQRALQQLRNRSRHGLFERQGTAGDVAERLGQELMVAAVRPGDAITRAQPDDGSDGATLLADTRVSGTMDQVLGRQLQNGLLEGADQMQLDQD